MKISASVVAQMLGSWDAGPGPAHQRLSDRLRLLVLDGRLVLDAALPSERDLALALRVSRTTVGTAYRSLADAQFIDTRPRSRAVVRLPDDPMPHRRAASSAPTIDLSFAAPAAPGPILHRAFATALERLPRYFDRRGYERDGVVELRESVARWYAGRGLATRPNQIMITNGALHAVALIARTLVRPGDRVVIDHPTYPHAIRAFTDARARLVPVALEPDGWNAGQLRVAGRGAAMAYLIPDFHNPTGQCMPARVRRGLELECPIVVDETMADLAIDLPRPVAFAADHPDAISIGSTSKSIWGGLRIGWIRARPSILNRLSQMRPGTDLGTPILEQLAASVLLDSLHTHLPDRVDLLRAQRQALYNALAQHLPDWTVPIPPGGLSFWVALGDPISSRLAAIAPDYGITLAAGPRFGIGGAFERHVRLPYSLPEEDFAAAVEQLAAAHRAVLRGERGKHKPSTVA
ncbi:MocR-like transcription factor YczR [Nocardia miyunensis]|uniref:MocR-like transcription factor YczR n=1 Tax=Nocardia miyunensis TaxID=282684 RepID=UPI00082F3FC9|nr:PLP-dependent aminotransferase family protein [Nocardia miyunensis]